MPDLIRARMAYPPGSIGPAVVWWERARLSGGVQTGCVPVCFAKYVNYATEEQER